MSKSKKHYTEEFKLTVLKDKYANNLSIYSAAKKYGIRSSPVLPNLQFGSNECVFRR